MRMADAGLLEQFDAGRLRHPLVGHDDVDIVLAEESEPFLGIASPQHVEAATQQIVHRIGDVGLIVDDEQRVFRHGWPRGTGFAGK